MKQEAIITAVACKAGRKRWVNKNIEDQLVAWLL